MSGGHLEVWGNSLMGRLALRFLGYYCLTGTAEFDGPSCEGLFISFCGA